MDFGAPYYKIQRNIQARILANVQQMIRYDTDSGPYRYNDGSSKVGTSVEFSKTEINHYVLDLGVPSDPTDDQWQAICKALQRAKDRVAMDPTTNGKDIDFRIKEIT